MKKFAFSSSDAKLKNMNVRMEGNEKAPVRAVDLKFEMVTSGDVLQTLFGGTELPDLWYPSGAVRYPGLDAIHCRTELQGAHVEFGDLGMNRIKLSECKVNSFSVVPLDSKAARLVLRTQIKPTDEELVQLSKAVKTRAEFAMEAMLGYTGEDGGKLLEEDEEDQGQIPFEQ